MGPKDPYDEDDSFEDEYFDGNDLDDDLLYSLFDEEEYDFDELLEGKEDD